MIDLLKVCANFKCPPLEDLRDKQVTFGPQTRAKVLVLDMDETLIHAKFLLTPELEANDNGDFVV